MSTACQVDMIGHVVWYTHMIHTTLSEDRWRGNRLPGKYDTNTWYTHMMHSNYYTGLGWCGTGLPSEYDIVYHMCVSLIHAYLWYILHWDKMMWHRLARLLRASMRSWHHFMQAAPPTISRIANYNNAWTFTIQIKHTALVHTFYLLQCARTPSWSSRTKIWSMSLSVTSLMTSLST